MKRPKTANGQTLRFTGFTKAARPRSFCNEHTFQPSSAFVQVFGTADPSAHTPVTSADFPVSLTVTESGFAAVCDASQCDPTLARQLREHFARGGRSRLSLGPRSRKVAK